MILTRRTAMRLLAGAPCHTLGPEKGKFVSQLIFTRSESDKRNHRGVQDTFRHRIFGQSRGRIELLPHYDD